MRAYRGEAAQSFGQVSTGRIWTSTEATSRVTPASAREWRRLTLWPYTLRIACILPSMLINWPGLAQRDVLNLSKDRVFDPPRQ